MIGILLLTFNFQKFVIVRNQIYYFNYNNEAGLFYETT